MRLQNIFFLGMVLWSLGCNAQNNVAYSELPKSGREIHNLIPDGWQVLSQVSGNLIGDEYEDLAFAIQSPVKKSIAYSEYVPEKKDNVQLENVHVGNAFQMESFILLSGLYMPKDGKIVFPNTETDYGYRLFLLNEDNEIHYKSKGFGDLYYFQPHFYKSEDSDKIIIICHMGFEYPFGGEVFIYQNEKIEHIGNLDIEGYDPEEIGINYLTDIIEIKEDKAGIEFSFKTDKLVLNPGGEHEEVITNNNVRYVYKNNELSLRWNSE